MIQHSVHRNVLGSPDFLFLIYRKSTNGVNSAGRLPSRKEGGTIVSAVRLVFPDSDESKPAERLGRHASQQMNLAGAGAWSAGRKRMMKSAVKKFTRQSLVELSSFRGCRILNSRCSMGQEILRATVVEDANLGRWAQPGDAVICSGYPFHAHMDRFCGALEQLHASGAAVLCIKAVRNTPFPEDAIELADRLDLLVVELPREAIFSTIIQEISEKILSMKAEVFSQLQAQTESLLEILFRENVLEDCFLHIEQFIGNPVVAFVPSSKLYMSRETREWLSQEDQAAVFHMFCRQRQTGEATLSVPIDGRDTVFDFIEIRMTGNETLLLGIAEWNQSTDELVFLALKRIGKFLAVEVKNATTVEKVQRRQEDTLINDLFSGEFASDSDVVAAAASYNYHLDRSWKYRIAIVRLLKRPDSPPST